MPEKCRESFLSNSSTPGARLAAVAPRSGSPGASPGDRRAAGPGMSTSGEGMEDLMWRRLVVAAALAVSVPAGIVVAAPASASAPSCNTASRAYWSTQRAYNFSPGGWCMTDGRSEVVWQSDGNLVWYVVSNGHVLGSSDTCTSCSWTTKTGASRLSFQVDGNIVVYRSDGTKLWQRGASSNRRSTTVYYWENYENSTCNNIMYSIAHTQLDPDPNLSGDLDRWEVCY